MTGHAALFYRDAGEYVQGVRHFLAPAAAAGEPAVVAVPPEGLARLRPELPGRPEFLDMTRFGANPGRLIPAIERMLDRHGGGPLHYVGEPIWSGRAPRAILEATRHEAPINLAWPGATIRVLCPYDASALPPDVLADAERTHPHLVRDAREGPSGRYGGAAVPDRCDAPPPAAPAEAAPMRFGSRDLARVRAAVLAEAERAGAGRRATGDLVLAVNEVAANSIVHAGGSGDLRVWSEPAALTCEIRDNGHIADPLAGRREPGPLTSGGRGLWLTHRLCDLVEIRTGRHSTVLRLHMAL
jgi:anti-sigma regulatory factor (Ser/Thr protein kinase)